MLDVPAFATRVLDALRPETRIPSVLWMEGGALHCGGARLELADFGSIHVAGLGKAAAREAAAAAGVLERTGLAVRRGPVVTKRGHGTGSAGFELWEAGHPISDESSLRAGQRLASWFAGLAPDALVVFCVSGGGSALAVLPRAPFGFADEVAAGRALVDGGAPISDANLLRRELSALRNGGLLVDCRAATVVTLVTADVPGDDLAEVASGPTLFRELSPDALRRAATRWLPPAQRDALVAQLDSGGRRAWHDRLRAGTGRGSRVAIRVADWRTAVAAARAALPFAAIDGFDHALDEPIDQGVRRHLDWLARHAAGGPRALVSAGELPVAVRGTGRGGRNTEFVLRTAVALWLERSTALPEPVLDRIVVASLATDGSDGPTDAAGGFLRRADVDAALARGLDPRAFLADSDSLTYLERCGRALATGPTGTNLMDLRAVAIEPPPAAG
ncbi:MAG: DUF4147 domain-containing protein [Planctomycetes bacterium]|nr:DUF4147 domain-containing protein [Planctomycetota bacterium]